MVLVSMHNLPLSSHRFSNESTYDNVRIKNTPLLPSVLHLHGISPLRAPFSSAAHRARERRCLRRWKSVRTVMVDIDRAIHKIRTPAFRPR